MKNQTSKISRGEFVLLLIHVMSEFYIQQFTNALIEFRRMVKRQKFTNGLNGKRTQIIEKAITGTQIHHVEKGTFCRGYCYVIPLNYALHPNP